MCSFTMWGYIFLPICGVNIPQHRIGIRFGGITHEKSGRKRNQKRRCFTAVF